MGGMTTYKNRSKKICKAAAKEKTEQIIEGYMPRSPLCSRSLFVICFQLKKIILWWKQPEPRCSIFYAQYAGIEFWGKARTSDG